MPAALTLILICPSPGSGSGTWAHFRTSGGPYPVITTALGMAVPSCRHSLGAAANFSVFVLRWLLLGRHLAVRALHGPARGPGVALPGPSPGADAAGQVRRHHPVDHASPSRGCGLPCPGSRR